MKENHTYSIHPGEKTFWNVLKQPAAQSFIALESRIKSVTLWLLEANNDSIKIDILEGGMYGTCLASALLPKGEVGRRSIEFLSSYPLKKDSTYHLRLSRGAPGTTKGAVLASFDAKTLAFEIIFDEYEGIPPVPKDILVLEAGYKEKLDALLLEKEDILGRKLIHEGRLTYEDIKDHIKPLMLCGTYLTDSGIYYLALGYPDTQKRKSAFALCVADGSQIISEKHDGAKITFCLGTKEEVFGSSLTRLKEPALLHGYLPVLINEYEDSEACTYTKETFSCLMDDDAPLISFTKIAFSGKAAKKPLILKVSSSGMSKQGLDVVSDDGRIYLRFSSEFNMSGDKITLPMSSGVAVYIARYNEPWPYMDLLADANSYNKELSKLKHYWDDTLNTDIKIMVPEENVMNAMKNLLIQNLCMGWRYSIGNQYDDFFLPESSDCADILGTYGYKEANKQILLSLLDKWKPGKAYATWEKGEKLTHGVRYSYLFDDISFVIQNKEHYYRYLDSISDQITKNNDDLLDREVFSGDISEPALYTHSLCVVYRGYHDVIKRLIECGEEKAKQYLGTLDSFKKALYEKIHSSVINIDQDTAFLPHELSGSVNTWFDPITGTRLGSYWNLCIHYALASGIIPYESELMKKIYNYMKNYGSFFLGMLRFNYYPVDSGSFVPGGLPGYATTGVDNVYAINAAESIAHLDDPDMLVLMLYSKLANGMTRGTYISGEGDTLGVYPGEYYRSMYLPPSSANNSLFLKLLRLMLITEIYDTDMKPYGLHLSKALPRHWLEHGKLVCVEKAPSIFGPVSFTIKSNIDNGYVDIILDVPKTNISNLSPKQLHISIRVPGTKKLHDVQINKKQHKSFNEEGLIDLSGYAGQLKIKASFYEN